jgi:Toxin co-regulated pilus biosynthesis protein Q
MIYMKKILAFVVSSLLLASFSLATSTLPGFDFAYEIGGDRRVAPLQVFDDGARTYIQWPTSIKLPNVIVSLEGKRVQPLSGMTPYYVIQGVGGAIEIRGDAAIARVSYVGERGRAPMQVAQQNKPVIEAKQAARIAEARVSTITQWEVAQTDRSLDVTLRRWAKAGGYTLQWQITDLIAIDRGASYTGTLSSVLAQIAKEVGIEIAVEGTVITATESQQ